MDNIVKLVFQSAVAGSGFDDFLRKTEASISNSNQLGQSLTVMSSKLGAVGAAIGGVVGNLVKGSLWGAATAAIMGVVEAVKKWRAEAALAAEENAKAFAKVQEKAKEAAEQMKSAYQKSNELIDAAAKKKIEDIELTKKQTKAELELAAAKAKAAGKESEAAALSRKAAGEDTKASKKSAKVTVDAAKKKLDAAKKQALGLPGWENNGQDFKFDAREWEKQRRARNGRMMYLRQQINESGNERAKERSWDTTNAGEVPKLKTKDELQKELESEKKAREAFIVQMKTARQAAQNIADAERVLTQARKEEKIAIVENQKSIFIGRTEAIKASKEEQLKALQDKQSKISAPRAGLVSEVSRWQGEFNQAFDLWRDPEAAQQAVDADKKRGEDMKAFRKAVNRYGGKGKIDEYAALMRAGDEEGMQDRLAQWRKSSKFTPQVEQMVKAAAADQNKNAAEKSLAQIEKNTGDLAKKIDELLRLK